MAARPSVRPKSEVSDSPGHLNIKGRSTMGKSQLKRAVSRAKG